MRRSLFPLLVVMFLGCEQRAPEQSRVSFTFSGGDGSSPAQEVFIEAKTLAAVQAGQRTWLSEKCPGVRYQRSGFVVGMGLKYHETIEVLTAAGLTNRVHFAYPQNLPE